MESVTAEFFRNYRGLFYTLRTEFLKETADAGWAHDSALRFLCEVMFLYFVQRRGCFGDDPHFIAGLWRAYGQAGCCADTFVSEWLEGLLAKAFGNPSNRGCSEGWIVSPSLRDALEQVPYLGGGFFERSERSRIHRPTITDACFEQVFEFLESCSFALGETLPLEQDVAVDPAMIGTIYESLVYVPEEADQRTDAGIFYTPRVEIDLMCRLALADWLTTHLGEEHKPLFARVLFACQPQQKQSADAALAGNNLWPGVRDLLRSVTVVDPACGSGSFLVGMLSVLDDLLARANAQVGEPETPFERQVQILAHSIHGVDIMSGAVEIARMRLWLQILAAAPIGLCALRSVLPLPNPSLKVRCGHSLVQEQEGVNLALYGARETVSAEWKARIARWRDAKLGFYHSAWNAEHDSRDQIRQDELTLFLDFVDYRIQAVERDLKGTVQPFQPEGGFDRHTSTQDMPGQMPVEQERDRLQVRRAQLQRARQVLKGATEAPFVWDIAFVEVLAGERGGFDIVLGNPPFVRQERIRTSRSLSNDGGMPRKNEYKTKLARSVYTAWPLTFGYKWRQDRAAWKLDARSDLYVYFCLHSLSLLGTRGTLCFITSNSWLDVRYGRDLQEFLLTRSHVKLVIDNQVQRSFGRADVNTTIVLLGAAQDTPFVRPKSLQHLARFLMFYVPFHQVLCPAVWETVARTSTRCTLPEYRLLSLAQAELLDHGMDLERKRFVGDKWGAKYLRAPEIYWLLQERCRDKLVPLQSLAGVRRGITTGANDFFFMDRQKAASWGIEEEFLIPAVKSPRECSRIWMESDRRAWLCLFVCHREREELQGTGALDYISHGETLGLHQRSTCSSRRRWWDLGAREGAYIHCNYLVDQVMRFYASSQPFLTSDNFQEIHTHVAAEAMATAGNSTVCQLFVNTLGRSNFGSGLLKVQTFEVKELLIPNPTFLDAELKQVLQSAGRLNLDAPERHVLDGIVFDMLGLTRGERDAVYEAVTRLVSTRLSRARSLRPYG